MGIAAGRTKYGATGNMTDSLGTKTISGSKIPYYIGFGDSTKDYINLNYKFNENWKLTHIYNKKEYSTNYNDAAGNVLQHFMTVIYRQLSTVVKLLLHQLVAKIIKYICRQIAVV